MIDEAAGGEGMDTITMRAPCQNCGSDTGTLTESNGQRVVRCTSCDQWAYNQPRAEAGLAPKSVRSTRVKPKVRARVFAVHNNTCVGCGRTPERDGVVLDLDHLIPIAAAKLHGVYDELIESEWNLAPMCAECNRGKQDDLNAVSIQLLYRLLKLKSLAAS